MAEIICLIGTKGGSGKTTLSHMLCYGLGLLGRNAACVMTDICRQPPPHGALPYVFADGRTEQARAKIISALRARNDWIGVIDGGANRMETDSALYAESDLVLLPFRDSQEDLRVVCSDLARLPRAYALPSQWPTNPWQYKASLRLLESIPEEFRGRILAPVFSISSSKLLLQTQPAGEFPTPLNNTCRAVARYLLGVLENGASALPAAQTAIGASVRIQRVLATREAETYKQMDQARRP
ncbi:ParA family protein [Uliginosibacterium sp. 31-16]|uniref:ParA family protein n=1 Tax=Uliginosibacterium sp. 31-16 TaxID=3068315 RepID=UPI00273FB89D|nr:ParA family protein [Uliginosibacterium sp. 31-16]MDP5238289.1 ParA family protein [Uliginosibacterium sp. 31-16]